MYRILFTQGDIMKKQIILLACFSIGTLLLTGCSNNAQTGALVGSLVGAGIGKSTSNHRDKRAVIGGLLGSIVGSAIGAERDRVTNNQGVYTTPYYQDGTLAKTVAQQTNISHTHDSITHTHPGGSENHTHNYYQQTSQQVVVRQPEYVYVDPYPVRTSIVLGGGYYNNSRYRNRRHHHRRHHYRNHNRHRNHTRHTRRR